MLDLIVRNANLPDGRSGVDIGCHHGKIVDLTRALDTTANVEIDAAGLLVAPPFIDSHFHMDATLSYGQPRLNRSGTLLEGIALWGELKPELTVESIYQRAMQLCRWAIAKGNLAIRTHVDVCDPRLLAVEALLAVRDELRPWLDLQLVAFPQDGYLRDPLAQKQLQHALDKGVDVVGGIPHFEATMVDGTRSVRLLCELAAERGLQVDLHCDESDDPMSRHIETLVAEARRLGMQGRVTGSHLTSMHSMDNYYVSKLLPLMLEAGVHAVPNPLINITIQGRHDTYPKRRGMTRVQEMLALGINVAMGHDCVMDPWYPLGTHDMLEVAHMGLHVAQMTGTDQMRAIFDCVTINAAKVLGLQGYGLEPGCNADMIVLQAADPIEALRTRATRLYVIRRGAVIASSPPVTSEIRLGNQSYQVDFRLQTALTGDSAPN